MITNMKYITAMIIFTLKYYILIYSELFQISSFSSAIYMVKTTDIFSLISVLFQKPDPQKRGGVRQAL